MYRYMQEAAQTRLLIEHLKKLNIYDLERLKDCFEYEYEIHPEKKDDIDTILEHITKLLTEYNNPDSQ